MKYLVRWGNNKKLIIKDEPVKKHETWRMKQSSILFITFKFIYFYNFTVLHNEHFELITIIIIIY